MILNFKECDLNTTHFCGHQQLLLPSFCQEVKYLNHQRLMYYAAWYLYFEFHFTKPRSLFKHTFPGIKRRRKIFVWTHQIIICSAAWSRIFFYKSSLKRAFPRIDSIRKIVKWSHHMRNWSIIRKIVSNIHHMHRKQKKRGTGAASILEQGFDEMAFDWNTPQGHIKKKEKKWSKSKSLWSRNCKPLKRSTRATSRSNPISGVLNPATRLHPLNLLILLNFFFCAEVPQHVDVHLLSEIMHANDVILVCFIKIILEKILPWLLGLLITHELTWKSTAWHSFQSG